MEREEHPVKVILTLKGCTSHKTIKRQENILSRIQVRRASSERVGGGTGFNIWDGPGGATAQRFKIHGIGWNYFREFWRRLEIIQVAAASIGKVGRSLSVCRRRWSITDGDWGIPFVCCRYLVGTHIGWDWFRRLSGELWRNEYIIGPGPTSVGCI